MTTAVLIIHILVIITMVGVILIQRSEGGGLGMGSAGGLMGARGASDFLTRTAAILATLFFVTSITLALLAKGASVKERSILAISEVEETGETAALVQQAPVGEEGEAIALTPQIPVAPSEEGTENTEGAEAVETAVPTIEAPVASDE
ncbi:MAG: preprotein translocase subunit SecG [bacterium]|nr:preprotein translocase subunit SecG [bacterium]